MGAGHPSRQGPDSPRPTWCDPSTRPAGPAVRARRMVDSDGRLGWSTRIVDSDDWLG